MSLRERHAYRHKRAYGPDKARIIRVLHDASATLTDTRQYAHTHDWLTVLKTVIVVVDSVIDST